MQSSNNPSYTQLGNEGKPDMNLTAKILKDRYKICPKCGNFTNYTDANGFCHLCGSLFISECPECKEPVIYPISKFCPVCGKEYCQDKEKS